MEICTGGRGRDHEEIVFNSRNCPLCIALERAENAEQERDRLRDELDGLQTGA